ncbi:hypothetical protein H0A36_02580 [Endozoicomonas sp. SM1973]|uniref:Flagellar protein FliT n=1 Tax=Spartinivicinus marinus TaxID=2994442 RepID=A0A853IBW0_9GAMM|nr:hypothetical protein [Spartinivicinus marinus]MCX4029881.1 hypothetical protein [Spartinivicinus marinus]NYZ64876.1 hypothetical protein [Spartinivicinus marinus]
MMKNNHSISVVLQLSQLHDQLQAIVKQQSWEQFEVFDQQCRALLSQLQNKAHQPIEVITVLHQLYDGYQQAISQYEQYKQQLASQLQRCQQGIAGVTAYRQIQN